MESLVRDTASRLGFILDTSRYTADISTSEARVRPAPYNVQPLQLPIHHLVSHPPFSYPQPNTLYTPHLQLPSNDSLSSNHLFSGYNLGLGMAGMSSHIKLVGSEYTTSSVYGSGTMSPPRNPTVVDPTLGQTFDSVATSVPARVRARTPRFRSRN